MGRFGQVVTAAACTAAVVLGGSGVARAAIGDEWHRVLVGAPRPGAGVVVAVVDTGVDSTHPAFAGRVLPTIDLVGDGRSGDPVGHGTHVAGTVGAADGPCGGVSMTTDVQILPVRVLGADGSGRTDTVVAGIRAAADAGADVINLSLGPEVTLLGSSGSGLEDGIRYAWSRGAIPVLAAGNNDLFGSLFGSRVGDLPAVVVTATDHRDRIASYATPVGSAMWGLAAPGGAGTGVRGEDVWSTLPGGGCGLSAGTSMAAPHVSGALAALLHTGLGPEAAIRRLLDTAAPVGSRSTYGAGRVDLAAAVPVPAPAPTGPGPAATADPAGSGPGADAPGDAGVPAATDGLPTTATDGPDGAGAGPATPGSSAPAGTVPPATASTGAPIPATDTGCADGGAAEDDGGERDCGVAGEVAAPRRGATGAAPAPAGKAAAALAAASAALAVTMGGLRVRRTHSG